MGLRFVILKTVTKGAEEIALEYDEKQLCERLKRRVREHLIMKVGVVQRIFLTVLCWSFGVIDTAVDVSFKELVKEFKEETVKLP